jgi:hypothetical protein
MHEKAKNLIKQRKELIKESWDNSKTDDENISA